jgi:hypothetical protein
LVGVDLATTSGRLGVGVVGAGVEAVGAGAWLDLDSKTGTATSAAISTIMSGHSRRERISAMISLSTFIGAGR